METADKIEALVARWQGETGGAERANFPLFMGELIDALGLPTPDPAGAGELRAYQYEAPVKGGSASTLGGSGRIDLYKRGCFVMEAKQSQLAPGEVEPELFGDGNVIPLSPAGARYDRLMLRAQAQAKNYAVNLPGSEPVAPFLIVCDVGRAFELFFDFAGNGRGYGYFPDKTAYRIPLARLREPDVQALFRDIWTNPLARDPKLKSAEVTRDVSRRLAEVSKALELSNRFRARELAAAGLESQEIEETALFLMRILFCMFAEDVGLLPTDKFKEFLEQSIEDEPYFERGLKDLWDAMGQANRSDRFSLAVRATVRYFNGGLFENNRVFALTNADRGELFEAARRQWRDVEPAIFGTLLEQALTASERAKLGAHYTPRAYVERLVSATIMDVLNAEWADVLAAVTDPTGETQPVTPGLTRGPAASAPALQEAGPRLGDRGDGVDDDPVTRVRRFHDRIAGLRILDPACGTGNFLYVAMEALERLEANVVEVRHQLGDEQATARVGPHQFFGLEKNPRAAKIAELVLWIGWLRFRIANDPDSITDPVLARGANINFGRHGGYDAVLGEGKGLIPDWPEADFIIGNPPFIGAKYLREQLGSDYAEALWAANPRVPKSADFVMQWWDRAAYLLTRPGTRLQRFGFVTTNSITQTFSRRVIEGYLATLPSPLAEEGSEGVGSMPATLAEGAASRRNPSPARASREVPSPARGEGEVKLSLIYAIPDHPWLKGAKDAAAVRIAMTVAAAGVHDGMLDAVVREADTGGEALSVETAGTRGRINADLTMGSDATAVVALKANEGIASPGVKLHGAGFIITPQEAAHLGLGRREGLDRHIRPYRNGRDLLQRSRGAMVIDLFGLDERQVRERFPEVYQHLLATVKPERDRNNRDTYRKNWWVHGEPRREMRPALESLSRFIATTVTAKHRIFEFLDRSILPDDALIAIASDDPFVLGTVLSEPHLRWVYARCGLIGVASLEQGHRYLKSLIFDPFPFPDATPAQRAEIGALAEELDATRKAALAEVERLTMTELYNLRVALKAGTLDAAGRDRAMAARAGIVDRLHDQIDAAVAAAYGWEWPLAPAEIVARLVALNAERAAEEQAGTIRWLRPDYQQPRFG